ncbi:MAG: sensor histidine kinase [Streptosporangiaceae bacterium]
MSAGPLLDVSVAAAVYAAGRSRLRGQGDPIAAAGGYPHGMATIGARPRVPALALDAALAVFVALFQVRGTILVAGNEAVVRPLAEPAYLGYVLLALSGLALLVRRRWPIGVFVITAAISVAYYAAQYPDGPGWIALFVAVYTLAVHGDGHRSLKIIVVGMGCLAVAWLLTADLRPLINAGWVFFRMGGVVMAAALGESVRTRRVIAAEAQDRAARAERTKEEEARRRVDAERLRIAQEIHDTVAHAIAVINVQAGVTAHVLEKRPQQVREGLATIERTSARALHELRGTLGVLRDNEDDRRGPPPGLGEIERLTEMAREAGIDVRVEASSPPRELPSAVDHAAYRILQESITNVIRHAGQARVTISIEHGPDDLEIRVADDGRGPSADGAGGGNGIVGMRERSALLGGELTAGPRPGGGFQVLARLPLEPDEVVRR